MALLARKVGELAELNTLLRGGVLGGIDLHRAGVYGLDSLTLIVTAPSATVTFDTDPEGAQQPLSLKQILTQINAVGALTGYATAYEGRLRLEDPNGVVEVAVGNGTANTILGLKDAQAGVVYAAPGGAAPALVSVEALQQVGGGYLVVTDEA